MSKTLRVLTDGSVPFEDRGAITQLLHCKAGEVIVSGPAGTGKSRGSLERLNAICSLADNVRCLMMRKTLRALTTSGLVTFNDEVLDPSDPVRWFGGSSAKPPQFEYLDTGSVIVVGGLDKAGKALSTQYDAIYVQQAEELTLHEWETLTTRVRVGYLPFKQLWGDVNPDAPTHWIKQREAAGKLVILESRHEDNPVLWNDGDWTPEGRRYIGVLDNLTGVRLQRLRYGRWVSAEGVVYEDWDAQKHLLDSGALAALGIIAADQSTAS